MSADLYCCRQVAGNEGGNSTIEHFKVINCEEEGTGLEMIRKQERCVYVGIGKLLGNEKE